MTVLKRTLNAITLTNVFSPFIKDKSSVLNKIKNLNTHFFLNVSKGQMTFLLVMPLYFKRPTFYIPIKMEAFSYVEIPIYSRRDLFKGHSQKCSKIFYKTNKMQVFP